ncbi:hypothetical protein L345_10717, partial [Ophiophagus hannah]
MDKLSPSSFLASLDCRLYLSHPIHLVLDPYSPKNLKISYQLQQGRSQPVANQLSGNIPLLEPFLLAIQFLSPLICWACAGPLKNLNFFQLTHLRSERTRTVDQKGTTWRVVKARGHEGPSSFRQEPPSGIGGAAAESRAFGRGLARKGGEAPRVEGEHRCLQFGCPVPQKEDAALNGSCSRYPEELLARHRLLTLGRGGSGGLVDEKGLRRGIMEGGEKIGEQRVHKGLVQWWYSTSLAQFCRAGSADEPRRPHRFSLLLGPPAFPESHTHLYPLLLKRSCFVRHNRVPLAGGELERLCACTKCAFGTCTHANCVHVHKARPPSHAH